MCVCYFSRGVIINSVFTKKYLTFIKFTASIYKMNKNTTIQDSSVGRPKNNVSVDVGRTVKMVGLPAMIEPTIHDITEELSMLDSYVYSQYND